MKNLVLALIVLFSAHLTSCANTSMEASGTPFVDLQTEVVLEESEGGEAVEAPTATAKGVHGTLHVHNRRAEPASVYINGYWVGNLGAFSSGSFRLADVYSDTYVSARCPSGYFADARYTGNLNWAYFTIH